MADFCIADHFILGTTPIPKPSFYERDTWAMRVGVIAPGIQLMQTMERWSCQRLAGEGVIGVCSAYDYLAGESIDAFFAGFNYVLDPLGRHSRLLQHAAEVLGDKGQRVSKGAQHLLCLQRAQRYPSARQSWKAAALQYLDEPLAQLAWTLVQAERNPSGAPIELVLGLWTAEHGYVHTGRLGLSIRTLWDGHVEVEATGMHNPIEASWSGPCAGFLSLQAHQKPVRVAMLRGDWPFPG